MKIAVPTTLGALLSAGFLLSACGDVERTFHAVFIRVVHARFPVKVTA